MCVCVCECVINFDAFEKWYYMPWTHWFTYWKNEIDVGNGSYDGKFHKTNERGLLGNVQQN